MSWRGIISVFFWHPTWATFFPWASVGDSHHPLFFSGLDLIVLPQEQPGGARVIAPSVTFWQDKPLVKRWSPLRRWSSSKRHICFKNIIRIHSSICLISLSATVPRILSDAVAEDSRPPGSMGQLLKLLAETPMHTKNNAYRFWILAKGSWSIYWKIYNVSLKT